MFQTIIKEPGEKLVMQGTFKRISKEPQLLQLPQRVSLNLRQIPFAINPTHILLMRHLLLLLPSPLLQFPSFRFFLLPFFLRLQSLHLSQFRISNLLKLPFMLPHRLQLLFLQNLHPRLLDRLPHQDLQNGLHFSIEVKQLSIFNLRFHVNSSLNGDKSRCWRAVNIEVCLSLDFIFRRLVSEFFQKLLGLYILMLPPFDSFRGRNVPLLHLLLIRVFDLFPFDCLCLAFYLLLPFQLRLLGAGHYHGRVSVPAYDPPVEHYVLNCRVLRLSVFGLASFNNFGLCRELITALKISHFY